MIELRQFRQFVAVAEELSFRRAAARLHMAQPPLTAAVRRMEEELGVVLLERSNRIERLTPAGLALLEEARRTLAQAERALSAAKRAGQGLSGSLRVSFVASAVHQLLPAVLRAYRKRHPDVALTLAEATTAQQVAALREDRVDLGIVVLPVAEVPGLTVELLRKDALVAALPRGNPKARRPALSLSELAAEPWVLFPAHFGPGLHRRILAACATAGFTPRVVQEAVQMETIASLVAGGIGVALVPPSVAALRRPGVAFRRVRGAGTPVPYDLGLAYARHSSALDAFIATARSVARASES